MNKIYKVMYSKVKQCCVVVSEIAKSHSHNGESSGVRKHAALTAAVLIALGSLSFTTAFVPMTAEAAVKTRTDGSNFVGVERTDGLFEDSDYANHNGQGAHGDDSITIGLKASGGDGTITIGDRRAEKSLGSVYVGRGPGMPTGKVLPSETDDGYWATSVGYQSDATGYGSIAIGSNATAKNSYDKDSTGHGIQLRVPSGDGSITLNGEPDIQRASVAIGYGASADNGNIAIGSYSDASTDLRTAKTPDGEEIKSYLTDNKADSYVSVGKTGALRRISNVADGAADSDAATIAQLKKAVEETDASKKANIDASNIGENLKKADGKTAADSSDKKNNKDAWGNAIGTGKVEKNNGQLVTGGTVYSALENQKKDPSVHAGWGISVAKDKDGKAISLNRNLGTNYGNPWKGEGKVTFEAGGENSMILGGAASILFNNEEDNVKAGAYGKDSVLVGGFNNLIDTVANDVTQTGENAVIVGGDTNKVTGLKSVIVGGYKNTVSGGHSIVIGGASNETDGGGAGVFGGQSNKAAGDWSSAIGGTTNTASGLYATTLGGKNNDAKGKESVVVGGVQNVAIGEDSTVNGGAQNTSYGSSSYAAGGMKNMAFGNASVALGGKDSSVNGKASTGIAGGSTGENAMFTLAAGYQSVVADSGVEWRPITQDEADKINQGINSWPGYSGVMDYGEDYSVKVLDRISTAVGYQSTADAPGVIAFGHDKGDVASVAKKWKQKATMEVGDDYSAKFYDANHKEISAEDYYKLANADGTLNDYTQDPIGTENTTYQSAYYNRLVKAADGIDAHDAVVMEQLKPYTKSDASNVGANLKTYTVGDDGETITEADATADQKKANENAWGAALGTGKVADPNATGETSAENNGSQQLVTGGTVFNETRISAKDDNGQAKTYNYLNANNSAGKNLEVLDSALKTVSTTAGAHTALTVEGNTPAGTGKDAKTNEDVYAGKNILLHESTDENGKVTYDLKLAKDINIGKPGKDGEDGKIGIDGKDGHIGLNGSDGITVRGLDGKDGTPGKDGVTITGPKGEAGKDGIDGKVGISGTDGEDAVSISGKDGVGHIGLTGPAGTNGKDGASIDITVKNGYDDAAKGINGSKGVDGKDGEDGITRIVYTDKTGDHQVATMEDGLKFKGDDGKEIAKKLNNTLDIIGGAKGNLTEGNIGVNSTDKGQLKVQLAKDLKGITSISNQTTTKDGDKDVTTGAKITLGADGNVDVNDGKITKVGSGIEKDATGNITEASKTNAANIGDVQTIAESTATSLTGKGLKFAANSGAEYTAKLGSTVNIQGTAKKEGHEYTVDNLTTEIDKDGNITILMDKDMSVEKLAVNGKDGKEGAPGTPGSIGISGQDGQSSIGIDGKDGISIKGRDGKDGVTLKAVDGENGTEGHIGLTGPAGTNGIKGADGQPGTSIDITVQNGYDEAGKDGKDGINGKNGVDGMSLTRIVYEDKNGKHQVATLEDGMKYAGDDAQNDTTKVIAKKLNNTLDIIGGADSKNLTEGNIGVNSTTDGQLKVQLAKDLKGITSISNQTTTKDGDKDVTTGAKITLGADGNVDVNDGKITHVGSGIEKDATGNITEASKTNAANIGDVQTIAESTATSLTGKGLKFAANSGAEYTAKLGSTVNIQGTAKKEGHEYTVDNLTTEIDKDGNITILMDKDMSVEKLAVNGKDGKEGAPGTPGSIGISGQDGQSSIGIDGKDGISIKGRDGKDGVTLKAVDGENGTEGHIGLAGPAGTNGIKGADGQPGTSIDITVKNGYDDGAKGIDGSKGVDGKDGEDGITRIVYTDKTGDHQVATMEDGMKYAGDDAQNDKTKVIAKKLNNTMEIIGGADSTKLTDKNIGVNSDGDKLKVQLSKDLTGMNSTTYTTTTGEGESATTSTTVVNGNGLTITDGPSITNKGIDGGNKVITNVGSGIKPDANGKYTVTNQNKGNAANIGDVQNMVNDAKTELTDGANGLNNKANIDASNIGANLKNADGSVASAEDQKANAKKWGSAIGTGEIKADDGRMVTGKTVYDEVRPTQDGNYVKKTQTTGENLSALDSKIGKLDETKTYNYIDSKASTTISDNLTKLDTQVKDNANAITNINQSISTLDQNSVKYDDSSKSKISLGGEGGTTITNVKAGVLSENSSDAVNGGQLWQVDQKVDTNTTNITKNAGDITNLKNLSNITDAGKTVIKNLSKDAVQVKAGDRIKVDETTDDKGNKTYTISANNNGTVEKDDGNLISGGTLYNEVRPTEDGNYVKKDKTTGQNLSALDSGLKTTSDLIHTNTAGDTIQIGGNSTATKIDVNGKDGKGRVITGVVTDATDPTSAANVGYVNGVTAANTQQIYRDMNNAYGRLNNNINKAAAGSNALAALHPLDYDPDDKADFTAGYGHYRNANAAAVGVFYHPNENTMVNVGVSLGNGDPGFNAGVSFKVGRGGAGREAMSRTEMTKVINSQSKEIDALKKDNADKDKRIDALEQKMAEILAKLDKNGK